MDEERIVSGVDLQLHETYLRELWRASPAKRSYLWFAHMAPIIREGLRHMTRAQIIRAIYELKELNHDNPEI